MYTSLFQIIFEEIVYEINKHRYIKKNYQLLLLNIIIEY